MRLILLFLAFVVQFSFADVCFAHFDYTFSKGQWIALEETKITEQFNCGVRFQDTSCRIKLGESKERTSEDEGCVVQGDEVFCVCTDSRNCNTDIKSFYDKAVQLKSNLGKCGFTFQNQPDYGSYTTSKKLTCPEFFDGNYVFKQNIWQPAGPISHDPQCEIFIYFESHDANRCHIRLHSNLVFSGRTGCEVNTNPGGISCRCTDHDMCSMDIRRWIMYGNEIAKNNHMGTINCDLSKMPSYPGIYPTLGPPSRAVAVPEAMPAGSPVNPVNPGQPGYPNHGYPQSGHQNYNRNHGNSWNR